jgi:raffinose/stachyose/melibiose transport system substrate-binding protein
MKKLLALLMVLVMAASLLACGTAAPADSGAKTETEGEKEAEPEKEEAEPAAEEEAEPAEEEAEEAEPAEEGEKAESTGVTIDFMHDWPEYTAEFQKMADDFEAETGIHVEIQIITWDVLTSTLLTDFASGEVPDVACCWSNQMGAFNSLGAVYDLAEYMDENDGEWRNSLMKAGLDLGSIDGKVFAVPYRTTQTVIAYNKTIFDENGWTAPTTLEEFEAMMDEMVEKGYTPLIAPGLPRGFQLSAITGTFAEQELMAEGTLKKSDYLSGHYTEIGWAYAKAGEKMRDWISKGYIVDNATSLEREEATALFYKQDGLMSFLNNNELRDVEDGTAEAGFEVGFFSFPVPEGMENFLYNFGVDAFMVYSGTEHPDESAAWLKYITSDAVQQKFGNDTKSIMGNVNCVYDDPLQNQLADIFSKASSYRINYDYNTGSMGDNMGEALVEFLTDDSITAEEYGATIQQLREDALAEAEAEED